jgi:ABC-2 type transport system ATP-binding protein
MRELFQALNRDGTTLFLSSHSISEVERLCHRVGILVEGRLARALAHEEWAGEPGRLERVFVETVREKGERVP